jgi:hypothetical protein
MATIVVDACVVVVGAHYIKFVQVELTVTMLIKVQKLYLTMTISTRHYVWQGKR